MTKNFKTAQSKDQNIDIAVNSIKEQLAGVNTQLIIYFVSSIYPTEAISKGMAAAFPGVRTIGCTTCGEMGPHEMGDNSIVAMAWGYESLKSLHIEVLENIKTDEACVSKAFASFEKSLKTPMKTLDPNRYVGILLIDGWSACEERINDILGNLTNVPFIGGSAGDDLTYKGTYLYVDGQVYNNAAVLMLMEPSNGFTIFKTQSFKSTKKTLVPTKVDEKRRMVIEFDGKPATEAFAESLGVSESDLPHLSSKYALALVFDEQNYFMRATQFIENKSIIFGCAIKEGLKLTIMEPGDIVEDTRKDLEKAKQMTGSLQAIIDFNCGYRFIALRRINQLQGYFNLFQDIETIGFGTYGECYIGYMNHTSVMLLLK